MRRIKTKKGIQWQILLNINLYQYPKNDWEQLGVLATKTNRTRSKMIGRLIRFFLDNKGGKSNGKSKVAIKVYLSRCKGNGYNKVYLYESSM